MQHSRASEAHPLDSLRAMDWREFEMLVREAFRRRGNAIATAGAQRVRPVVADAI